MDDLNREIAGLRFRLRLQMLVTVGALLILLFARGGADVVAGALVDPDAWTIRTKSAGGVLTNRLVVTTDVDVARIKVQNANLELAPQTTAQLPSAANPGALAFDSTTGTLKVRNNASQWLEAGGGLPAGTVLTWTTVAAPTGFLLCNGQAVSRTTYASLFTVIGTTFGPGDGSTTFNLPDMRGRIPVCLDNLGGTSADRVLATQADNIGQAAGEENHILSVAEMPAHNHPLNSNGPISAGGGISSATNVTHSMVFGTTGSTGSGAAHNNMQPYLTLAYIIKT